MPGKRRAIVSSGLTWATWREIFWGKATGVPNQTAGPKLNETRQQRGGNEFMRLLNRLYAFLGWAIVALGGLHMLATLRLSASTPAFRVWFFGSGVAMGLGGALNLLHRAYGRSARGLRIVCRLANILLTLLGAVAGAVTGASLAEYV